MKMNGHAVDHATISMPQGVFWYGSTMSSLYIKCCLHTDSPGFVYRQQALSYQNVIRSRFVYGSAISASLLPIDFRVRSERDRNGGVCGSPIATVSQHVAIRFLSLYCYRRTRTGFVDSKSNGEIGFTIHSIVLLLNAPL